MGVVPGEKLFLAVRSEKEDGRAGLNVSLEREPVAKSGIRTFWCLGRVQKSLEGSGNSEEKSVQNERMR